MKTLSHITQRMLTWLGIIAIVSAYEKTREQNGFRREYQDVRYRLETHIILFPWINSRLDYKAMELKMILDWTECGYDYVEVYRERFIGKHELKLT